MASSTSYENLSPSVLANPGEFCTLSTCPLSLANIQYVPSFVGNALYASLFGAFLTGQLFLGIHHRNWGFLLGMFGGIVLEIVDYNARIQMHYNPFQKGPILMHVRYLMTLNIAPAFLSASIYLAISRIIPIYSCTLSRFKPRTYAFLFVTCDIIALLLQAAGGAIASFADNVDEEKDEDKMRKMGIDIMVAGVSWQVFSLGLLGIFSWEFAWRIRKAGERDLSVLGGSGCSYQRLGLAPLAVFVRSVFRCAELREGFRGKLANQQVTFMGLEGGMIVIAVGLLTVWHPGLIFQGTWQHAGWRFMGEGAEERKVVEKSDQRRDEWMTYGHGEKHEHWTRK
ncbi:hypothetical protein EPUS_03132 [Endocarpon pusillum Z07020]|uniref:RTA1 domain protein n=1 Tax=Endocarpon pusillum (strain Z07020 / HMAS-L-300199) TaxID=1263415 RepID=U1HVC0_ENDPU|nr:uncharacterized protein EPUS_03132 [Endocarpon pusillum Z07020]ERF73299.1 hypothetical protein EPUS_03132 [Endocarpon pusillum Z07020]